MARFTLPRDLYHGKGALEALKTFKGKKAMICVGGGSMKRFGFLDKAEQYLKEAGMEVQLFEGIELFLISLTPSQPHSLKVFQKRLNYVRSNTSITVICYSHFQRII